LLAYAAGAATSLAVALLIGGKVFAATKRSLGATKRSLGAGEWIRRGLGVAGNIDNVRAAVKRLGIDYPVAIDNSYAIWRGFNNEYWRAHYFIDAEGRIRHHHFGEGDYAESEHVIQELLREAGHQTVASGTVSVSGTGVEEAADMKDVESPETYIGTDRAENFASPGGVVEDQAHHYTAPRHLPSTDGRSRVTGVSADRTPFSHNPTEELSAASMRGICIWSWGLLQTASR
jgi:Thioredoxin like C-terminal domain